jgi:hypothetical protein
VLALEQIMGIYHIQYRGQTIADIKAKSAEHALQLAKQRFATPKLGWEAVTVVKSTGLVRTA